MEINTTTIFSVGDRLIKLVAEDDKTSETYIYQNKNVVSQDLIEIYIQNTKGVTDKKIIEYALFFCPRTVSIEISSIGKPGNSVFARLIKN